MAEKKENVKIIGGRRVKQISKEEYQQRVNAKPANTELQSEIKQWNQEPVPSNVNIQGGELTAEPVQPSIESQTINPYNMLPTGQDPDEAVVMEQVERDRIAKMEAAEGPPARRLLGDIGSIGGGIAGGVGIAASTPASAGTTALAAPAAVGGASYIGKKMLQSVYDWVNDYSPYVSDEYAYQVIQEIGGKNTALSAERGESIDQVAVSLGLDILSGDGLLSELAYSYAGEGAGAAVKGISKIPYAGAPLRKAGEFIQGAAGKVAGTEVTEKISVGPSEGSKYIQYLAKKGRKPLITPDEVAAMQRGELPNVPFIAASEAETMTSKAIEGVVAKSQPVREAIEASERAILPTSIRTRKAILSGVKEQLEAESRDLPEVLKETSQQYTDSIINATMTDLIDITPLSISTQAKNKYIKDVMREAENSYYELFRTQKDAILPSEILATTITPRNIRGHDTLEGAIEALNRKYGAHPPTSKGVEKAMTDVAKRAEGTPMQVAVNLLSELGEEETAKTVLGAITDTQFTTLDDLIKLRSNYGKVAFKRGKNNASDYARDLYSLLSEAEESGIREAYMSQTDGLYGADDALKEALATAESKVNEYRLVKAELARNLDGKNKTIINEILNNPEIDNKVKDNYLAQMLNSGEVEKTELYKWAKQAGKEADVKNALKLHQSETNMNQLRVKLDDWLTGEQGAMKDAIEKDWISSESTLKKAGITENGKNDLVRFLEVAKRASGTGLNLASTPGPLKRIGYLVAGGAVGLTSVIKPSIIIPIAAIATVGTAHAKKIALAMASNPEVKKKLLKSLSGKQLKDIDNFGTVLYKALIESSVDNLTEEELEEVKQVGDRTIRLLKEKQ